MSGFEPFEAAGRRSWRTPKRCNVVVIAQPHQLGDVLLTFPVASAVKQRWPRSRVYFAARNCVRPLVEACQHVDEFLDSDAVVQAPSLLKRIGADIFINPFPDVALARAARIAGVPVRVGNIKRLRGALHCNRFMVRFGAGVEQHTIERNLSHLRPLGFDQAALPASLYGLRLRLPLEPRWSALLDPARFNLILHLKSGGHGHEWPLRHFQQFVQLLKPYPVKVFLTGTAGERAQVEAQLPALFAEAQVVDLMGRLDLPQFLAFIEGADGMIASSTGPIHIAAALGRHALGVYPCGTAIDPARWAPIGALAETITAGWRCDPGRRNCPMDKGPACPCTVAVSPHAVLLRQLSWLEAWRPRQLAPAASLPVVAAA